MKLVSTVRGRSFNFWGGGGGGVGDLWSARFFFLATWWVGYFFYSSARIFFYYLCAACNFFLPTSACRKFFFKITHPLPQELNGRPLRGINRVILSIPRPSNRSFVFVFWFVGFFVCFIFNGLYELFNKKTCYKKDLPALLIDAVLRTSLCQTWKPKSIWPHMTFLKTVSDHPDKNFSIFFCFSARKCFHFHTDRIDP